MDRAQDIVTSAAPAARNLLSTLPAGRREHVRAGVMLAVSFLVFLACAPFARTPLAPVPGFLPAYQSALMLGDVVTAALLLGQFTIRGSAGLLVLACAYLFSAATAGLHALSFPGLFLAAGLPGGGGQTTAWLYFLWHAGFPLAVLAYALLPGAGQERGRLRRPPLAIAVGLVVVIAAAAGCAWLATKGQALLPPLMEGNRDGPGKVAVASACWLLAIGTLPVLWRRKPHTALDLWLLVVMCAWIFEVALAAVLNGGRYDLGWFAGRVYGLLAAGFVLIVLLLDNATLYDEMARAHATELARSEELRQAKAAAEEATLAKAQFLANMSHEIRTPMNAVLGMTQLALKGELPARQRDYLEKALRAGRHLLAVLNDILDFSKADAGKLSIEKIDFSLEQTLANVGEMVGEKAGEKGLELVIDVADDVPQMLHGDPLRLSQVLVNLANNAVKFTEHGEVAVACRVRSQTPEGLVLAFEVSDTGIGIPPEQCGQLFQSFRQADDSITRRFGGTGLGLAISARLVALMGGEIGVRSEPGRGSTFWFTVHTSRSSQQPRPRAGSFRGRRALVVDDHEHARAVMAHMLRAMGLDVVEGSSGPQALKLFAEARSGGRPFDVVVLDWQMPQMDGIQVARRLRADPGDGPGPAMLLVTAYSREEAITAARSAGIADVLVKPVSASLVHDAIAACLHRGPPAAAPEPRRETPLPARRARLLLVEDHPVNRIVAKGLLAPHGIEVDEAVDGSQAVAMLAAAPAGRWHAVFMDMQMPVMDGLAATRAIRGMEAHRDLPIIAMTANALAEDRERCLAAGMNDHLAKPIVEEELQRIVDRWLGPAGPLLAAGEAAAAIAVAKRPEEPAATKAASAEAPGPLALASTQADQALALLERAVAHDMRAGLGVVTGFGKLLKHRLAPSDEAMVEQIDALHDSAREVVGLVDAWRAAGLVLRQPMTMAPVDMQDLARHAAVAADAACARLSFEPGLPQPTGDAALLERVWRELLDNAVKFARAAHSPRIEAWGRMQDGVPVYGVRDDGIGIEPSRADRLFRPLQRLHGDLYPGFGLGLFVASALVARHGGLMWLQASGEDAGTCVCFRLQG